MWGWLIAVLLSNFNLNGTLGFWLTILIILGTFLCVVNFIKELIVVLLRPICPKSVPASYPLYNYS